MAISSPRPRRLSALLRNRPGRSTPTQIEDEGFEDATHWLVVRGAAEAMGETPDPRFVIVQWRSAADVGGATAVRGGRPGRWGGGQGSDGSERAAEVTGPAKVRHSSAKGSMDTKLSRSPEVW